MSSNNSRFRLMLTGGFALCVLAWSGSLSLAADPEDVADDVPKPSKRSIDLKGSTHKQFGDITIRGERAGHQLQTFCLDTRGNILAIVAPPRSYGNVKLSGKNNSSEIRVFDGQGEPIRQWTVDFAAQAIAVAPNGTIFVSGNGKIAKYDAEGKELACVDLPHIGKLLGDSDALREQAQAQLDAEKEQFEAQAKEMQEQIEEQKTKLVEMKETLKAKDKEQVTASEKRKVRTAELTIRALENQIKSLARRPGQQEVSSIDDIIAQLTSRLKVTNALAASDHDVFIASGVLKGYGYAIWRTTHSFEDPQQIVSGLSGCCGQMDIHCCETDVYVAENSRKSVVRFDREGKKIMTFGKGERNGGSGAGFGGCCNPMNLCFNSAGNVLTAESEGYIKEFTKDGKFIGIMGQANVSGGCKNVALAVSPDGERAYFFDLQGSRIVILGKKNVTDRKDHDEGVSKSESSDSETAITLSKLNPARAADSVREFFLKQGNIVPFIESDSDGKRLLVRGTAEQLTQIKGLLKKLGESVE